MPLILSTSKSEKPPPLVSFSFQYCDRFPLAGELDSFSVKPPSAIESKTTKRKISFRQATQVVPLVALSVLGLEL